MSLAKASPLRRRREEVPHAASPEKENMALKGIRTEVNRRINAVARVSRVLFHYFFFYSLSHAHDTVRYAQVGELYTTGFALDTVNAIPSFILHFLFLFFSLSTDISLPSFLFSSLRAATPFHALVQTECRCGRQLPLAYNSTGRSSPSDTASEAVSTGKLQLPAEPGSPYASLVHHHHHPCRCGRCWP